MPQEILLITDNCEILLRDGAALGRGHGLPHRPEAEIFDLRGMLVTGAFTDLHVHLREPGYSYKETILSGTAAAARGGYSCVCAMPNLKPAPDSPETLAAEQEIIRRDARISVLPYATITRGRSGSVPVDFAALKAAGALAFSDDGSGVQSDSVMLQAMTLAAQAGCAIAAHCEVNSLLRGGYIHDGSYARAHGHRGICSESEWREVERNIRFSEQTGCRLHICHVSTKESVDLVRAAKLRGLPVTCETGPHYLVFCDEDLQEDGRWKMNPPLRSAADREALIEGLADGTVDAIATDHAPHSAEEKSRGLEFSAMGIVGLETAFSALYTHLVLPGRISMERLLEAMQIDPVSFFGSRPSDGGSRLIEPVNLVAIDLNEEYTVRGADFASMGKSTPFEGMRLRGKVKLTIADNRLVFLDGKLSAPETASIPPPEK